MMEDPTGLLIVCVKCIVHVTLLFFIITGYSAFLAYVRTNAVLYQRSLNVLFCQLALLYLLHILCQATGVISVLWWNVPTPANIMFQKVNMTMALVRGLLFTEITLATYLK